MKNIGLLFSVVALLFGSIGCQQATNSNANANSGNSNSTSGSAPTVQATQTAATDAKTAEKITIKADTPTDAYKTALAATKAGDFESLKKVVSKDVLEFFKFMSEGGESSDELMSEMLGSKQGETGDVRNEKISGNKATIEYKDEKGEWKTMDFVKEGGSWKMTIPKGDEVKKDKK